MKTYAINEIFYSLQGEGKRAGTANVFIRFSGCNLKCTQQAGPQSPGGFDCDTEFASGWKLTHLEIFQTILKVRNIAIGLPSDNESPNDWGAPLSVILTGGEPALQIDLPLLASLKAMGVGYIAIETNGSIDLHDALELPRQNLRSDLIAEAHYQQVKAYIDWVTVSPKVAEHAIRQTRADEVKYVRGYGQAIPKTVVQANHYLISPAFDGQLIHPDTLGWCTKLCLENPKWALSLQQHKQMNVR